MFQYMYSGSKSHVAHVMYMFCRCCVEFPTCNSCPLWGLIVAGAGL